MPEDYISKVYSGMKSAYSGTGFTLTESQFRDKISRDPSYASKVYSGMNTAYSGTGFELTEDQFVNKLNVKKKVPSGDGGIPGLLESGLERIQTGIKTGQDLEITDEDRSHLDYLKSILSPHQYKIEEKAFREARKFKPLTETETVQPTTVVSGAEQERLRRQQEAFSRDFGVLEKDDPIVLEREERDRQIASITDPITADFVGQSEEQVVSSLQNAIKGVDDQYDLFEFREKGIGYDALDVVNKYTGDKISISLDNWTTGRDRSEAEILKAFIDLNARFPEYSVVSRQITEILEDDRKLDPISSQEQRENLRKLLEEKEGIKTQMRSYAKGYEYLSYVYNQLNETNSFNFDFTDVITKSQELQQKSQEYQEQVDFLKEADFTNVPDEQRQQVLSDLQVQESELLDEQNKLNEKIYDLTSKQSDIEEIAGLSYGVAEERGNLVSGVTKSFAEGLSTGMAFAARAAGYKDVTAENISKDVFYDGIVDKEYLESDERNMLEQALFGITESAGAALSFGPAGPASGFMNFLGLYSMSYMDFKDEMNAPEFKDVSEGEKIAMSAMYGATVGLLDRFGLSKTLSKTPGGKRVVSWILNKTVSSIPKKASFEIFERELKSNTKIAIQKGVIDVLSAGGAEAGTEALQEFADIAIKDVYNEIKGKEMFDTPDTWAEAWSQVSDAAIIGFIGGGTMNGLSKIVQTPRNQWTKSSLKSVEKLIADPETLDLYSKYLRSKVLTGELTQEELQSELEIVEQVKEDLLTIPENLSEDDKHSAFSLISERRRLQNEIEGKEPNLVYRQREKISEINSQLKTIAEKAQPETTVEEKPVVEEEIVTPEEVPVDLATLENVEIKTGEEFDTEYKIDGGFYSESEFIEKLNDPDFITQVQNNESLLEITNPSQEVTDLLTHKIDSDAIREEEVVDDEKVVGDEEEVIDEKADDEEKVDDAQEAIVDEEQEPTTQRVPVTGISEQLEGIDEPLIPKEEIDSAINSIVEEGVEDFESKDIAVDSIVSKIKESDWYSENIQENPELDQQIENFVENLIPEVQPIVEEDIKVDPEAKERAFAGRVSEEIRQGLSENAKRYIPTTNEINVSDANAIIEAKGEEQAHKDVLNTNNKMEPRVRVTLGQQLIKRYIKEGTEESTEKAVELTNSLSEYATKLGQAVQAFSLWDQLSSEGLILGYERSQDRARENLKKKKADSLYQGAKRGYTTGTKGAAKKAAKEVFKKNTPKVKKAKAFNLSKQEIKSKKAEALKKFKDSFKGKPLTTGGINVEALEAITEYGFYVFAEGVQNFNQWASEMTKATGLKDKDVFRDIWENYKTPSGKTLKQLSKLGSIEDIAAEHFAESSEESNLSNKLKEAFDLDDDLANSLASEITNEFNKIAEGERKKAIRKQVTGKLSKKVRDAIDAISQSDALTSKEIDELIEEAFGIKKMTPEQLEEVKKLTEERDKRPEGFLKEESTREVLAYFDKINGVSKGDILWSMWYASVLSGYETQMLNVGSNALNIMLEQTVTAIEKGIIDRNGQDIAKSFKGLFSGAREGMTEFNQVISKGYSPSKITEKFETKDTLENVDFIGGKLNPATYYKYVGRFMSAVDSAAYLTARGARMQVLAQDLAREEGLKGKALQERVSEILNDSESVRENAIEKATKEIDELNQRSGEQLSRREKKRLIDLRTREIIEESIPEEITRQANRYGSFVTFNYDPEGILGLISGKLSAFTAKVPAFRLVVPFTRVVANVLNQQIDYTPYGYLRAYGVNIGAKLDKNTNPEDIKARNRQLIKASVGTMLMIGLYAIAKSYEDDEDPYFEITGKGPLDFKKKNQLYSQGWRPYSIKIGDRWISYQYTPVGLGLSWIGNTRDQEKYGNLSEADFLSRLTYTVKSSASGIFDMSFLTGLSGLMNSLSKDQDSEEAIESALKAGAKIGTSFIPNLFKQLDKLYDPTIYDAKTVQASILKEIPILKRYSGLKPKINAFGQPVQKTGNKFFGQVTDDKVWNFMAKHRVFAPGVSPATKMLDGEVMTNEQFYDFAKKTGEIAYERISEEIDDIDSYLEELESEDRQKYINQVFTQAKSEAKYYVWEKYN